MDLDEEARARAERFKFSAESTLQTIKARRQEFSKSQRLLALPTEDVAGAFGVHPSRPPPAVPKPRTSVSGVKGLLTQVRRAITGKSDKPLEASVRRSVRGDSASGSRRSVRTSSHAYTASGASAASAAASTVSAASHGLTSPTGSVNTVVVLPADSSRSGGEAGFSQPQQPGAKRSSGGPDRTSLSYTDSVVPARVTTERISAGRGIRLSGSLIREENEDDAALSGNGESDEDGEGFEEADSMDLNVRRLQKVRHPADDEDEDGSSDGGQGEGGDNDYDDRLSTDSANHEEGDSEVFDRRQHQRRDKGSSVFNSSSSSSRPPLHGRSGRNPSTLSSPGGRSRLYTVPERTAEGDGDDELIGLTGGARDSDDDDEVVAEALNSRRSGVRSNTSRTGDNSKGLSSANNDLYDNDDDDYDRPDDLVDGVTIQSPGHSRPQSRLSAPMQLQQQQHKSSSGAGANRASDQAKRRTPVAPDGEGSRRSTPVDLDAALSSVDRVQRRKGTGSSQPQQQHSKSSEDGLSVAPRRNTPTKQPGSRKATASEEGSASGRTSQHARAASGSSSTAFSHASAANSIGGGSGVGSSLTDTLKRRQEELKRQASTSLAGGSSSSASNSNHSSSRPGSPHADPSAVGPPPVRSSSRATPSKGVGAATVAGVTSPSPVPLISAPDPAVTRLTSLLEAQEAAIAEFGQLLTSARQEVDDSVLALAARITALEGELPSWRASTDSWAREYEDSLKAREAEQARAREREVKAEVAREVRKKASHFERSIHMLEDRLRGLEAQSFSELVSQVEATLLAFTWNGFVTVAAALAVVFAPMFRVIASLVAFVRHATSLDNPHSRSTRCARAAGAWCRNVTAALCSCRSARAGDEDEDGDGTVAGEGLVPPTNAYYGASVTGSGSKEKTGNNSARSHTAAASSGGQLARSRAGSRASASGLLPSSAAVLPLQPALHRFVSAQGDIPIAHSSAAGEDADVTTAAGAYSSDVMTHGLSAAYKRRTGNRLLHQTSDESQFGYQEQQQRLRPELGLPGASSSSAAAAAAGVPPSFDTPNGTGGFGTGTGSGTTASAGFGVPGSISGSSPPERRPPAYAAAVAVDGSAVSGNSGTTAGGGPVMSVAQDHASMPAAGSGSVPPLRLATARDNLSGGAGGSSLNAAGANDQRPNAGGNALTNSSASPAGFNAAPASFPATLLTPPASSGSSRVGPSPHVRMSLGGPSELLAAAAASIGATGPPSLHTGLAPAPSGGASQQQQQQQQQQLHLGDGYASSSSAPTAAAGLGSKKDSLGSAKSGASGTGSSKVTAGGGGVGRKDRGNASASSSGQQERRGPQPPPPLQPHLIYRATGLGPGGPQYQIAGQAPPPGQGMGHAAQFSTGSAGAGAGAELTSPLGYRQPVSGGGQHG